MCVMIMLCDYVQYDYVIMCGMIMLCNYVRYDYVIMLCDYVFSVSSSILGGFNTVCKNIFLLFNPPTNPQNNNYSPTNAPPTSAPSLPSAKTSYY